MKYNEWNTFGIFWSMNCKLEKFWNLENIKNISNELHMNCKLEKFWNNCCCLVCVTFAIMNCKLEKFWNDVFNGKKGMTGIDEL